MLRERPIIAAVLNLAEATVILAASLPPGWARQQATLLAETAQTIADGLLDDMLAGETHRAIEVLDS